MERLWGWLIVLAKAVRFPFMNYSDLGDMGDNVPYVFFNKRIII